MTLNDLAIKHATDKNSNYHNYCPVYESYLEKYRQSHVSVIEIGAGGYDQPDVGGHSYRMWYDYFRNGKIIGIDIYPKNNIINDRTEFWQGSQTDKHLLSTIIERETDADMRIFIDDASHINPLTIETFKIAFPLLKSGDLYFAEDLQVSYWEGEYQGHKNPHSKNTSMQYFTELTHQLNYEFFDKEFHSEFAGMIEWIHFYKEIVVIKRK